MFKLSGFNWISSTQERGDKKVLDWGFYYFGWFWLLITENLCQMTETLYYSNFGLRTTLKNYWGLHFLISAVTNYHKFSGIRPWNFITLQFWRLETQNWSYRVKESTALMPSKGSEESLFPCFLQFLETTYIPWLMTPSSHGKCEGKSPLCHHLLVLPLSNSLS